MLVGRGPQPTESLQLLVLDSVENVVSGTAATADVRFMGGAPLPGVRVDPRSQPARPVPAHATRHDPSPIQTVPIAGLLVSFPGPMTAARVQARTPGSDSLAN
jgi:hypothetical protein